jgi:hypothetical protein
MFSNINFKHVDENLRVSPGIKSCSVCFLEYGLTIACELKPIIGDEYPCILRKFKEQRDKTKKMKQDVDCYVIAFQTLTAETASFSQLQEIFKQSDIPILIIDEDTSSIQSRLAKLESEKNYLEKKLKNLEIVSCS